MSRMVLLAGRLWQEKEGALRSGLATEWWIESCDPAGDPAAFARLALEADAIVGGPLPGPWPAMPKLRLFQIPFAGYDFLRPELIPAGAVACNTYEHESAIAEYVLWAMLEWELGVSRTAARFKAGSWEGKGPAEGPVHGEVRGKTVGIVGYGHIGHEVARRARTFQMNVVGVGRRPKAMPPELDWYTTVDEGLDRLLATSDYVLVACPLTEATRGLIDAGRLAQMKPSGVIINVARGAVIDEDALYEALRNRRIGGAVIDVWYRYPSAKDPSPRPGNRPFHQLDNIIMTPHNSGWTQEQIDRRWVFVCQNLDRLARGEALENVVFEGTGTR